MWLRRKPLTACNMQMAPVLVSQTTLPISHPPPPPHHHHHHQNIWNPCSTWKGDIPMKLKQQSGWKHSHNSSPLNESTNIETGDAFPGSARVFSAKSLCKIVLQSKIHDLEALSSRKEAAWCSVLKSMVLEAPSNLSPHLWPPRLSCLSIGEIIEESVWASGAIWWSERFLNTHPATFDWHSAGSWTLLVKFQRTNRMHGQTHDLKQYMYVWKCFSSLLWTWVFVGDTVNK